VRERDDHTVAGTDERAELVLGFGEPARDERGPLRLERERLVRRKGVKHRRALERHGLEAFLLPHRSHLVHLPDEIGPPGDRRDEVVRDRSWGPTVRDRK